MGQAPRLIHRLRTPVVVDTSAFSAMNQTQAAPVAILPGGPVRDPQDVIRGLGLSLAAEQSLVDHVREWVAAPDPISFRRSLMLGVRALAPADLSLRSEIARRCVELWRASSGARPRRWGRYAEEVIVQKAMVAQELDLQGLHVLSFPVADPYHADRRALRLKLRPTPPELVWMVAEGDDLEDRELEGEEMVGKAAGHKYLKRVPSGKHRPRWRYFYKLPSKRGLTSTGDLVEGSKIRVKHAGHEGHFEIVSHDRKKGIVRVRHDESGREAHIHERDLHRMVQSYHRQKTVEAAKKEGTAAPALPRITMTDLARGEYDNIEGFAPDVATIEAQAAAAGGDREWAVMKQPNGFTLLSKRKRETGKQREVVGERYPVKLRAATGKGIDTVDAEFVLIDVRDMIPSHKPDSLGSFPIRSDYPENVQERRYHAIESDRNGVYKIARDIDPAMLVNTNPDAVNGPPIMTQDRVVLGGNKRTMAVQVAYREYPESAKKLREYLIANARKYGVTSADVRAMEQPMIARRMRVKDPGPGNARLKLLGRRMNESLTHDLDPRSEEVAVAQFVTSHVTDTLVASIEPEQTLADFLYSAASADFVVSLRQAGIVDELNQAKYIADGGKGKLLSEDGRRRVERVMAARLIPNADILEKMNPTLRESLAVSTPSLLVAEGKGWPIATSLRLAVEADLHIRDTSEKPAKVALAEFLEQTELKAGGLDLAGRIHADPVAKMLLHIVREKVGTDKMPRAFRGFALRATQDHEDHAFGRGREGAIGTLVGLARPPMTPAEALDIEFGVTPEAARAKREREATAKEEKRKLKEADAERKRLADLQAEEGGLFEAPLTIAEAFGSGKPSLPPPSAGEIFGQKKRLAASDRSLPTLVKATGPNALLNRAIHLIRWLVEADIHRATTNGRRPRVAVDRIVQQVMEDAQDTARNDTALAGGLSAVTEAAIRGLVQVMVAMVAGEINKGVELGDLIKARQNRPPGAGWGPIPGGKKGGFRKMTARGLVYWYHDRGFYGAQKTLDEQQTVPEVNKGEAAEEAQAVEDLNEVNRANVIVGRVLASLGATATPELRVKVDYRPEIDRLKKKISGSRSIEEISHLQEQARAVGKRAGDAAREWELRQQQLFEAPPGEPPPRELTDQQVVEHAKAIGALGITPQASTYLSRLVEEHGKLEARKVLRYADAKVAPDRQAAAAPRREVRQAPAEQTSLFGLAGESRGAQGSLFDRGIGKSLRFVVRR